MLSRSAVPDWDKRVGACYHNAKQDGPSLRVTPSKYQWVLSVLINSVVGWWLRSTFGSKLAAMEETYGVSDEDAGLASAKNVDTLVCVALSRLYDHVRQYFIQADDAVLGYHEARSLSRDE